MKKPNRIKTDAINPPANREQADKMLADIGKLQRQVQRIDHNMNDELSKIKAQFEETAAPLNDAINAKFHALHTWAEANRNELLPGNRKTAKLPSGEISWRKTPPRVAIRGMQLVIDTLKKMGHNSFIRTKEEVNKEAILAEPEAVEGVKGISITSKEEFAVKPFESDIERVETVNRRAA